MTFSQKLSIFLLRISAGWLFFYAGITKVTNPDWSAAGYLSNAKMFAGFYNWLLEPGILPIINFTNEWGLTLLGISLMLGIGVRWSSTLGAILMLLYYFPILDGAYPNPHSYIVDEHIIYALVLMVLAYFHAGSVWGVGRFFPRLQRLMD